MFTEIALSIFQPGVNSATKHFTYGVFIALIIILGLLLFSVGFNIHLVLLLILSISLLMALIW